jgi:AbrB family looped-hinge helix DNA binding protein
MALARSKLTAQAQISIPSEIRRRLGLRPGSVIEWKDDDGRIVVCRASQHTLDDTRRALGFGTPPTKRSLKELREGVRTRMRARYARG